MKHTTVNFKDIAQHPTNRMDAEYWLNKVINRENAMTANRFEHRTIKNSDGTPARCRRTGKTKTWKTRPDEFKIPVRYGLYSNFYITHQNSDEFFIAD